MYTRRLTDATTKFGQPNNGYSVERSIAIRTFRSVWGRNKERGLGNASQEGQNRAALPNARSRDQANGLACATLTVGFRRSRIYMPEALVSGTSQVQRANE